jgi:acyl dehydratase
VAQAISICSNLSAAFVNSATSCSVAGRTAVAAAGNASNETSAMRETVALRPMRELYEHAGATASRNRLPPMATVEVNGVEGMQSLLGQEIGPSEWRTVDQGMIDDFAEISGDDQWIHVDVERAEKESPFGTTIAHGNLTLSLVDGFRTSLISSSGFALGVNYGWNKIRFPAPVPAGSKVRARAEVVSVDEVGGGWWQVVTRFTLEVEGSEKPCFVGDSVTRVMAPAE